MYHLSPFTYLVDGMLSTGLANTKVVCSSIEFATFNAPSGKTCAEYLRPYIDSVGGYIGEGTGNATQDCKLCPSSETNAVLVGLSSNYSLRWRNFGILWVYVGFNICAALFLYWLARVPKKQKVLEHAPPGKGASRVQSRRSEVKKG